MGKCTTISLLKESIGSAEALRIVNTITAGNAAVVERKIYYPYFWFSAKCTAQTLIGSKPIATTCLVDGCNGIGATADPVVAHAASVSATAILNSKTGAKEAARVAHRYLTHHLGRRLRTIGDFAVELEGRGIVHKAFWLVRCGDTVVMVDSLSGCLHSLGERAA